MSEGEFGLFATAFDQAQSLLLKRRQQFPLWPLFEMFNNKLDEPMNVIKEWLDPIVKNALELKNKGEKKGAEESSFLEYMVDNTDGALANHLFSRVLMVTDEPLVKLDVQMIREELLNILVATRDTVRYFHLHFRSIFSTDYTPNQTSSLLTFVTYIFTQHPEIVSQLRGEIIETFSGDMDRVPTYDDLRNMKYRTSFTSPPLSA